MRTKIYVNDLSAKEIMQQHGLPIASAYRARKAGFFFARYSDAEPGTQDAIMQLMAHPAINRKQVLFRTGVSEQKYHDIKAGKSTLMINEAIGIIKEVRVQADILELYITRESGVHFRSCVLENPYFKHNVIVGRKKALLERIRNNGIVTPKDMSPLTGKCVEILDLMQECISKFDNVSEKA